MTNVKLSLISLLACAVLVSGILGACAKPPGEPPSSSEPEASVSEEASKPEDWEEDIVEPEQEESEPEPEQEESEPESSSEESSEPEEPKNNPFVLDLGSLTDMYVLNPAGMIYNRLVVDVDSISAGDQKAPIIEAINALPRLDKYDYDKSLRYSTGFLIYDQSGARHEYNIIPGALIVNGTGYYLPKENYEELMALAGREMQDSGYAQWLVRISPPRVTGIEFTDEDGGEFSVKAENLQNIAKKIRGLTVSGGRTFQKGHYELMGMDGLYVKISFDTGVTFTMLMDGKHLYMESSDMSFGCRYDMRENVKSGIAAVLKAAV